MNASGLEKKINQGVGKAIHDWNMIREGDRILVAASGGKDSQVLLDRLFSLRRRSPVDFELVPVHIDPGFDNPDLHSLKEDITRRYGSLVLEKTDHGILAHAEENRENPCFLCARLRRKRLFELAEKHDCKKIALGHNKDDLIETLFINIFYSGKMAAMKPRQSFFKGLIDIIRPLSYVEEKGIRGFCKYRGLTEFKNYCPSAGRTKRKEVRQMLADLYSRNEHIKGNIFRAMHNINPDYLLNGRHDRHTESA